MSTSPSCSTPVSLRPSSPNLFDQDNLQLGNSFDSELVNSPGSKRCPTFKEYQDKIKQLTADNFQLRLRIYLSEHKTGVKTSASDLAVLISQFQNGNPNMALGSSHSTVHSSPSSSSAFEPANNELCKLRSEKHQMSDVVTQLEEKLQLCEKTLIEKERQNISLSESNAELQRRNLEITQQLADANSTIQKLNENQCTVRTDEEVDRLACIAFGQESDDIELVNAELEAKVMLKTEALHKLQTAYDDLRRKLHSADKKITSLKSEIRKYENAMPDHQQKITEMSDSLKDMGIRFVRSERECERLRKKLTDETTKHLETLANNPNSDKLTAVQQVVGLFQSRMKELTAFVETLLQLESKQVFSLTGLTDEHRENLIKSIEQSRMFSDSLDQLLEKDRLGHQNTSITNYFNKEFRESHHVNQPTLSINHSRNTYLSRDRIYLKSDGVQCSIIDSSLQCSLDSANSYINTLKHDISIVQRLNNQLNQDKMDLISQLKTLESSVNVLRISNYSDAPNGIEMSHNKIKDENRKLIKRLTVTEDALRHLHTQHAKLVAELKTLRSTFQKSKVLGSTHVDSTRPSDSTSPDLGIDSGHDGAMNSDDSNGNNYKEQNRILRTTNRELAMKLKQTKQALDNTLEKLNSTTKEKEQVEKAICRQLHKTHTILRQAKRSVEKFTNSQCQENISPSS